MEKESSTDELVSFINDGGLLRHNITSPNETKEAPHLQGAADNLFQQDCLSTETRTLLGEKDKKKSKTILAINRSTNVSPILEEVSSDKTQSSSLTPTRATGFDIKDPVELLFLLDEDIASGRVILHKWQIQFMMDFARHDWSQECPFQAIVRACNGSGKDKYIVSSCVVWLCMAYLQARGVVTSSSGIQLDNQTDTYITMLCNSANSKIAPNIWKCNYRYYECLPTGSPITLFATDEAGKAEGYHPLVFGAKMALFESEAKTVPDEIHNAMSRCTGYTHRCLVSTPGLPMGHMYDLDTTAIERKSLNDWTTYTASDYIRYHITAYDCSHIPRSDIERGKRNLPGGETGAAFKSQYLAEYGTTDEMVVIAYTYVWRSFNPTGKGGWRKESFNKAGLDLSDGGDETVLTIRNGNKRLTTIPFRFDNTEDTVHFLDEKFRYYDLNNPSSLIFGDAGGLGKPILDRLKRMGWNNIRYVLNQSKAYQFRVYKNRGAEMWFNFGKWIERHEIDLRDVDGKVDEKLIRQLSTRYYKITSGNVHQLLSKLESRSRGYPSPDRADSMVLAFCDFESPFVEITPEHTKPFKSALEPKPVSDFTLREYVSRGTSYYDRNPSANKDFSLLREDIEIHNKQRRELLETK